MVEITTDTALPKADETWQNVALKFTVKIREITIITVYSTGTTGATGSTGVTGTTESEPTLLRVHFMRQDNLALGSLRGDYFLARYKKSH